jgi:photosystem II stability/assembly factor-like uncharacterized protein
MHNSRFGSLALSALTFAILMSVSLAAQEITPQMLAGMRWRSIGPFRAGRVTAVCGVAGQPSLYYMATPGGGVWKTDDGGQVWKPIFDHERMASIGALVVAPSNPNVIYVGSGEQTQGDGVYKSTDAGATWTNVGLTQTHIITGIVVDPANPDVVLVGAAGDHDSVAERGIYKTTDGGKNWQKVLFKDNETGVADLESAPDNPHVLYATLWLRPTQPFTPGQKSTKQDGAIYRSDDQGSTWTQVGGKGLPADPWGRVGVAVVPGKSGQRLFAIMTQGLFVSDDGGSNWQRSTSDPRIIGNGYFSRVYVDPKNADTVYVMQTSMYRSTDGGRTFEAFTGAPSGDDFHVMWINPSDDQNIILGVDQGAIVSANGGKTWSSWYNQPTGQFYHVNTDNEFPYYVYGAQQDSGTAGVISRSNYGEITYRDWEPVGGFEFAYITPDPQNPNYIYSAGWYGSVLRFDRTTGQITHLFAQSSKYRSFLMPPIAFAPHDPHILYIGAQYVLKSSDGGSSWQEISPDLTQKAGSKEKPQPFRNVITTMALSTAKPGVIWVGTGNGILQMTDDIGAHWKDVSIPNLPERSQIAAVEASRHDPASAYAVVAAFNVNRPLLYRTHDSGQTWQMIVSGIPENETGRIIREDPARKGLLYAGTAKGIYISFDNGEHWQSLQLNLPTSPVTDLDIHGGDLVASTFGRSLWILDDITPLRQLDARLLQTPVSLLHVAPAYRARWDMNQDTPLPQETPAGQNPPDGAIINYFLKSPPAGTIKLSIFDSKNNLVREFSDVAAPIDKTPANVPEYWFAAPTVVTKNAGLNRFIWDLRYAPPKTLTYGYFNEHLNYIEYTLADHAIPGETPREQPQGPFVVPGEYSVALTVDGQTYRQSFTVKADPRVHASQADLAQQLDAEQAISNRMNAAYGEFAKVSALRQAIADRRKSADSDPKMKDAAATLKSLDAEADKLAEGTPAEFGFGPLNRELGRLGIMIESGDAKPAALLQAGLDNLCRQFDQRLAAWRDLNSQRLPTANATLKKKKLQPLPIANDIPAGGVGSCH